MVLLGWIPTMPFARARQDSLSLPGKGEYMIMHNLCTCWEEQAAPHSIRGGRAVHVFSSARQLQVLSCHTAWKGSLLLCSSPAEVFITCRGVHLVLVNLLVWGTLEQSGRICPRE